MDIPDLTCTVLVRPYRWPWRIHIAIYRISIEKIQIPVNILPRTVRTSRLDQNVALRMRINGHTRLDLYSSCTAVQVTLKNSQSYIRVSSQNRKMLLFTVSIDFHTGWPSMWRNPLLIYHWTAFYVWYQRNFNTRKYPKSGVTKTSKVQLCDTNKEQLFKNH